MRSAASSVRRSVSDRVTATGGVASWIADARAPMAKPAKAIAVMTMCRTNVAPSERSARNQRRARLFTVINWRERLPVLSAPGAHARTCRSAENRRAEQGLSVAGGQHDINDE